MKEISDFSTPVMWRNLKSLHMWINLRFLHIYHVKLIHMWRNLRFLHICHVLKFEMSPHDIFFSPRAPPVVSVTNIRYVLVLIFKSVLSNSPFSSQLLIQRYFKLIVRQVNFTTHIYMYVFFGKSWICGSALWFIVFDNWRYNYQSPWDCQRQMTTPEVHIGYNCNKRTTSAAPHLRPQMYHQK